MRCSTPRSPRGLLFPFLQFGSVSTSTVSLDMCLLNPSPLFGSLRYDRDRNAHVMVEPWQNGTGSANDERKVIALVVSPRRDFAPAECSCIAELPMVQVVCNSLRENRFQPSPIHRKHETANGITPPGSNERLRDAPKSIGACSGRCKRLLMAHSEREGAERRFR